MIKKIFYSNLLESLFEKLRKNLFSEDLKNNHYIFVPNKFIKNWLMKNFCDDEFLKVSFDLRFISFSGFLNFIQNSLEFSRGKRFLNYLELNLVVRQKILKHLFDDTHLSLDLKNYLFKNNQILEKRLLKTCDELTKSFLNYCIFGNYQDLSEKKKLCWQASLFYEIFYIDNNLLAFRDLKNLDTKIFKNSCFHFFSINYIPALYFDYISKSFNACHYIKSPCKVFWEDIASDYERNTLKKYWIKKRKPIRKIDELDSYLKERNSFLANMEKVKRKYFSIINNYDDDDFFENFSENQSDTILRCVQNDILNLENPNLKEISKLDTSFQIHIATNKFREVQVLHSNILNILASDEKLNLSDIHVLIPNINDYVPYIHMIFNDEENPLNYKIANLSFSHASKLISGIDKLVSLAKSKWEKSDIIKLFENLLFQKKGNISNEELVLLFDLIEKANISFGLDEEHISKFFKNQSQIKSFYQKSFDKGLARILFGMIYYLHENISDNVFAYDFPVGQLDLSNCSSVIDKFLKIISSILEDLKIIEEDKMMSLKDWRIFFKKIISDYFLIDETFIEKASLDVCLNFLQDLKKVEFRFRSNVYSFDTIYDYFKKYIERSPTYYNLNNEQAIFFTSFDNALISSKAIFVLGLEAEAIKFNNKSSIDINDSIDMPLENDFKRSLFLEAILSAKDYLFLSYPSSENYKIEASSLLQEFLFYLDNSYIISNQKLSDIIIKKHSSIVFDKENLKENNFSKINVIAAKSYYEKSNNTKLNLEIKISKEIPDIVDIKSMRMLCSNPIKFYLNKGLEIYLKEEKEDCEFNFSFLDKYLINQASFKHGIENILHTYEKKAKVPLGIFYEIEKGKILEENKNFQENLLALGIDKSEFQTIEFNLNVDKPMRRDKSKIYLPPLEVKIDNKTIKVIGKLENVTNKGLFLLSDDKLPSVIRAWSDILIYSNLDNSFSKNIIFSKTLKIKSFNFFDIGSCLSNYFEYYSKCLNEPSFMIKYFIEQILCKDEEALSKAISTLYENKKLPMDIYIKWFLTNYEKLFANQIVDKWASYLQNMFKPVLEEF